MIDEYVKAAIKYFKSASDPTHIVLGGTGDPSLAEEEGRVVAREARALGVNHILAPVADVNVDPDNPVINARSFGEDPADVARLFTAVGVIPLPATPTP